MFNSIKKNRKKLEKDTINSDKRKYYSPITLTQYKITIPMILKNVKGNLIDVGCGDLHYKRYIEKNVINYDSIDIKRKSDQVKYEGNILDMSFIADNTYDSAICLEVLEHVTAPDMALKEINRILKKDAVFIISVPHLSRLHEQPYDFFRFTNFGLATMLENSGFIVKEIIPRGGILTFLGHQISSVLVPACYRIPILKTIMYIFNKYFIVKTSYFFDCCFDKNKRLASGYTCLAIKK